MPRKKKKTTVFDHARRRLMNRLTTVCRPHFESHNEPPFTIDQLVVIALIYLGSATQKGIHQWIEYKFQFYQTHGIPHVSATGNVKQMSSPPYRCSTNRATSPSGARRKYEIATFSKWQIPIAKNNNAYCPTYKPSSINEVRCFLQPILNPNNLTTKGSHDQFSRLPPELRNRIYDMVLAYPRSGVCVDSSGVYVISTEIDDTWDPMRWSNVEPHGPKGDFLCKGFLKCPPLKTHLAILALNRQIREEAIQVFYGNNNFVCTTPWQLAYLTWQRRAAWIRSVTFHYQTFPLLERYGRYNRHNDSIFFGLKNLVRGCDFHLIAKNAEWSWQDLRYGYVTHSKVLPRLLRRFNNMVYGDYEALEMAIETAVERERRRRQVANSADTHLMRRSVSIGPSGISY